MFKKRIILVVAAAALLSTACIKVNLTVDVNEDGSGTVEGVTAFNYGAVVGLLDDLPSDGGDIPTSQEELCSGFEQTSGVGDNNFQETRQFDEDGFCGVEFKGTFDEGELGEAMGSLSDGAALTRDGDGWLFEMEVNADDFSTDGADLLPGIGGIFDDAEYVIRIRLPGRQVETNGTTDGDGFVFWDIDITDPPARIFLRTEPGETITGNATAPGAQGDGNDGGDDGGGGGGNTLTVILIVIAVLVALGLAAYFLMRKRDKDTDAPASGIAATISNDVPTGPPVDPTAAMPATPAMPAPKPISAPAADPTAASASPTPEEATGQPVWDPARGRYVQWDPVNNRWLVHDDATGVWAPE